MSRTMRPSKAGARACVAALSIGLVASTFGAMVPAHAAAPPMPSGLNVDQPLPSTTKLNWNASAGADRYEVVVDNDADFSSPEVQATTVNTAYVPTVALKTTTNYWRVRAATGADWSAWNSGASFDPPAVTRPQPLSPIDGATLKQPDNPPVLSWTRSPGAKSYTVEVDSDADFVGASTFTTDTTSLAVTQALGIGDWFWRVTAVKATGIVSLPSEPSSFVIEALAPPRITGPLPPAPGVSPDVIDVVLDWEPVPGAIGYELQVAENADFTTGSLVEDRTGPSKRVFGTRFSPAETYDNNGYYWRVRAVDTGGNSSKWAESEVDFNRHYEISPQPVFPPNGAVDVPDPLYFQWEAVTNASEYEIWVGTDENFSPDTYNSCRVAGTTYTPGIFAINDTDLVNVLGNRINEDCDPKPGVTNYWRVKPLDRPNDSVTGRLPGIHGDWSPTQSFDYSGFSISNMRPANGTLVDVPTLSWDVTPGALTYTVTIRNGIQIVDSAATFATSYTPKGASKLVPGVTYTWTVYAQTAEGTTSLAPQRTFQVSGTVQDDPQVAPLTPLGPSTTSTFTHAPSLTWEPEPTAAYYRVHGVKPNGTALNTGLFEGQPMPYPAMTDITSELKRKGVYTWWVTAHRADGTQIGGAGPTSTFEVRDFAATVGQKVALNGRALDANNTGQTPCTPTSGVCTVPATPVLKWDRDPDVAFYMVYVSENPSFSNLLEPDTALPATTNSMYMPALDNRAHTYGDNQTSQPYYWFVRPCRAVGQCGPGPGSGAAVAQHSFFKKSPPVTGLRSTLTDQTEVTFEWDNYWHDPASTAAADVWAQTDESLNQSAQLYRIQIATDSSFSSSAIVESADVDQTTFTSTTKIYPTRTYWWRVQAIDSDDNGLTWSTQEATFVRSTPAITLKSPSADEVVSGTPAFTWAAQSFAKAYEVEVYKNDDPSFSVANRVANGTNLPTSSWTWNKALAPSPTAYRWRVRRIDASGNPGSWTSGRFFVSSSVPTIVAPAVGALQAPDGPVLEWQPLDAAASYTVTVSPVGGGSNVVANTVSTAWAATSRFATGDYTWRLDAKDGTGNVIGTSSSSFKVNAALVADLAPQIMAPDGTAVGKTLSVQPPTWRGGHTDVTTTYAWLRDGQLIGASGTTYEIKVADLGKQISVKATGKKANYSDGTSTSNPVTITAGDALTNTARPTITGTAKPGSFLTATNGTWSPVPNGYRYQWLRNGADIPGETRTLYAVQAADIGALISVRVTASASGYNDGVATSDPVGATGTVDSGGTTTTGGAVSATSAPTISGTPGIGQFLTAQNASWTPAIGVTFKYQWLRDGAPIAGAAATLYRVTAADIGHTLSVTVTGSRSGMTDGAATSAGVPVPTASSSVAISTFPTIIKPSQRAKLTITVTVLGITQPTGKLVVKDGKKTVAKVALKASKNGKLTYKLPRLKPKTHKIKVMYSGSTTINKSKSKVLKLVVKR